MRALLAMLLCAPAHAQSVLHYTETSGFDHGTRDVSFAMFQDMALEHGFTLVNDDDGASFNSLAFLQQFAVIVFSNTSGDDLLDATQRANFEAYMAGGGSVMGIHAATDTYRHSTANGNNTGTWDVYAEIMGASVQENPNHVEGTPLYDLSHIGTHPSTVNLPDPWAKNEEYYYWEGGYYREDNMTVLEVEETVGPNGEVNSYDAPRPMSWYRELPEGGRVFYTALGHAASNYSSDMLFRQHFEDALIWLIDDVNALFEPSPTGPNVWPVPSAGPVRIDLPRPGFAEIEVMDLYGRITYQAPADTRGRLDLSSLHDGVYFLRIRGSSHTDRIVINK